MQDERDDDQRGSGSEQGDDQEEELDIGEFRDTRLTGE